MASKANFDTPHHLSPATMPPHHAPGHSRSRSRSQASIAASEATSTFYSFQDLDLAEPPSHPGERPPRSPSPDHHRTASGLPAVSVCPLGEVAPTEVSGGSEPRPSRRASSSISTNDRGRDVRRVDSGYESNSLPSYSYSSSSSFSSRRPSHHKKSPLSRTAVAAAAAAAAASATATRTAKAKAKTTAGVAAIAGSESAASSSVAAARKRRRQSAHTSSVDSPGPVSHLPRHIGGGGGGGEGGAAHKPVSRPRSQHLLTHRWALQQQHYHRQHQRRQHQELSSSSEDRPPRHPSNRPRLRSLPDPPPLPSDSLFQFPRFCPADQSPAAVSGAANSSTMPLVDDDARASGAIVANPLPVSADLDYLFPSPSPPPLAAALPMSRGGMFSSSSPSAAPPPPLLPPLVGDESPHHYGHPPNQQQPTSLLLLPPRSETPTFPLPAQTTHYWTSDRTRRLEYAAIDAATKGVKGWVMRHVVPDCLVPRDSRRAGFEEDGGSVIRYRIELEETADDDNNNNNKDSDDSDAGSEIGYADSDNDDDDVDGKGVISNGNFGAGAGGAGYRHFPGGGHVVCHETATTTTTTTTTTTDHPANSDGRRMSLHQQLRQHMRLSMQQPSPSAPTLCHPPPPPSRHRRRVFSLDEKRPAAAAVPTPAAAAPARRGRSLGQKKKGQTKEEELEKGAISPAAGGRASGAATTRRIPSWKWFLRPRRGGMAACL